MMAEAEDKRVIACNVTESTSVAAKGALAYLQWPNNGNGNDRIPLLIRSRGGRWVEKWESMRRLGNFRFKTLPPEHPLYDRDWITPDDVLLTQLQEACEREQRG